MSLNTYFSDDLIFSLADFPSLLDEFWEVSAPSSI
jgi:hypothetical protein